MKLINGIWLPVYNGQYLMKAPEVVVIDRLQCILNLGKEENLSLIFRSDSFNKLWNPWDCLSWIW